MSERNMTTTAPPNGVTETRGDSKGDTAENAPDTGMSLGRRRWSRLTGTNRAKTVVAIAAAASLALAACGTDDPETDAATQTVTETTTSESTAGTDSGDGATGPGNADESDRRGTDPVDDADLPGTDVTTYFSQAGATANVVGVKTGDVLFVRELPDASSDEVGRLAPTGDATLAGRERSVGDATWAEVELADGVGWVNSSYLAFLPEQGRDFTSEATAIAADADSTDDAAELARHIGEKHAETLGGGAGTRAILVETPAHDVLVYRVDILGLRDDSVRGERLDIRMENTGDGHEITEATSYPICGRGAGEGGLCA